MWSDLQAKLQDGTAVIGVIGLGYVGLPLAMEFARKYSVFGFDVRPELVQALRRADAPTHSIGRRELLQALDTGLVPTTDLDRLGECDVIVVAVGTPVTAARDPDLSQIEDAAYEIAQRLRPGQFVILESTSYPGTTEEVFIPALETSGLRAGVDFGAAYSPERVDPGNPSYRLENIPKIVGGTDPASTEFAAAFYGQIVETVVPLSHARVAEAAKIIENLFRAVNIALVNETSLIMERLGIDVWEAIRAASTKPFGFMQFWPGPGVGGHCIPVDPFYLSYRARKAGYMPRFIELSAEINEYMKFHVVELLQRGLQEAGKKASDSMVAILGLAFKRNVRDARESPAIRVIEECRRSGMRVRVHDPHLASIDTRVGTFLSHLDAESAVADADAAILLVDHDAFQDLDFDGLTAVMAPRPVWVDARGVLATAPRESIALGIGRPSSRIPRRSGDLVLHKASGTQIVED